MPQYDSSQKQPILVSEMHVYMNSVGRQASAILLRRHWPLAKCVEYVGSYPCNFFIGKAILSDAPFERQQSDFKEAANSGLLT